MGDDLTDRADAVAEKAHAGQVDKQGLPYITHPRAVARLVAHRGPYAVAVALLHDVLEDTSLTAVDLLSVGMPHRVVDAVEMLTRPKGMAYEAYVTRVIEYGGLAVVVKWGDVQHHMSRLNQISDLDERARLAAKYIPAMLRLEAAAGV